MDQAPTDSRYTVLRRLASGGMADVYLATLKGAAGFEKQTIVKRIRDGFADDVDYRRMFVAEARLMASLSHANIVSVLDFGEGEGGFFIALEYVDGLDLAGLIKRVGRLAPPMAIHLCSSVLHGLAYVHARTGKDGQPLRIVHRDVSPSNVFLGRNGDVKLGDFGVAKVASAAVQTQPGTVKGKLAYMSPEQAAGDEVDGRADLYSMGVVIFEALFGKRPDDADGLLQKILRDDPSQAAAIDAALSPALVIFLRRALSGGLEARFQTAEQMARELVACASGPLPGPTDVARLVAEFSPTTETTPSVDPFALALGLNANTAPNHTATAAPPTSSLGRPRGRPGLAGALGAGVAIATIAAVAVAFASNLSARPTPQIVLAPPPSTPAPELVLVAPASPDPVVPATAPSRPRPIKPARAMLSVNSTPWAKVFVDGAYRGDTPLQALPLEPGRHKLRLINPASNRSFETPIELTPGEQRTVPIDLETGRVTGAP